MTTALKSNAAFMQWYSDTVGNETAARVFESSSFSRIGEDIGRIHRYLGEKKAADAANLVFKFSDHGYPLVVHALRNMAEYDPEDFGEIMSMIRSDIRHGHLEGRILERINALIEDPGVNEEADPAYNESGVSIRKTGGVRLRDRSGEGGFYRILRDANALSGKGGSRLR